MNARIAVAALTATTLISLTACAKPVSADTSASASPTQSAEVSATTEESTESVEPTTDSKDTVTAMTVRTTEAGDQTIFDYSGLGLTLPKGSTHRSPYEADYSWKIRFEVPNLNLVISIDWLGDEQVGPGQELADAHDVADQVIANWAEEGITATSHPLMVQGASDSVLLTWVEPATEDSKEQFPDIDKFACKVAYILGSNDYYYEATFCYADGDTAAEALTDEAIASLAVDTGYPGNREN